MVGIGVSMHSGTEAGLITCLRHCRGAHRSCLNVINLQNMSLELFLGSGKLVLTEQQRRGEVKTSVWP